ncbi:hypothetical protein [Bradyrhizobium sp. 76]|uniref:hypothetical protein n=1 Tax=Bradyrhizobium sp. 76 TaxID=2782680 RepID=UPI001FFC10E3|nr:hypothetical protein [Bradyrhizobium sp. 76]
MKILAGQPDGRGSLSLIKQHLAVFYTSGPEWTARMKLLAERAPQLDIFAQRLVVRDAGDWVITEEGRAVLEALERPVPDDSSCSAEATISEGVSRLRTAPTRSLEHRKRRTKKRRHRGSESSA